MRSGTSFAVVLLMMGVALAGCSGSDAPPVDGSDLEGPSHGADTGGIKVTVFSDELVPIAGAGAFLSEDRSKVARQAGDGVLIFDDLAPGKYTVVVQALGFRNTQRPVDVVADRVSEVSVTMEAVAIAGIPYHLTFGPFPGKFFCGWAVEDVNSGPCKFIGFADESNPVETTYQSVADGERNIFEFREAIDGNRTEGSTLESVVVEISWVPASASATTLSASLEELPETPGARQADEPKYFRAIGTSPLRFTVTPEEANEGADEPLPEDAPGFLIGVFPSADQQTVSVYTEQQFEVWFTLFYNEPAEPGFTVLPDA